MKSPLALPVFKALLSLSVLAIAASQAQAAPVATVQSAANATLRNTGETAVVALRKRMTLDAGDLVKTNANGRAGILLLDGSQITLGKNTTVEITERTVVRGGRQSFFRALGGDIYARLKPGSAARTRTAVAGVRGTYIRLQVDDADGTTTMTVIEGSVDYFNDNPLIIGDAIVNQSQQSTIAPDKPPTPPINIVLPRQAMPAPGQTITGEGGLALNPTGGGIAPGTIHFRPSGSDFGKEENAPRTKPKRGGGGGDDDDDDDDDDDGGTVGTITGARQGNANNANPGVAALVIGSPNGGSKEGGRFRYFNFPLAGRLNDHIELSGGISRLQVGGDGASEGLTKTGINLGIKYLVNPDAELGDIQFAVGGGYDRALLKNWRAYGVASKAFRVRPERAPIMGHLGVRFDHFDLDDVGGPESNRVSVFAGTEIPLTRSGNFALTGEIQSKNNDFNEAKIPFSVGFRYQPKSSGFTFSAGYQRQGLIRDEGFYAQIGYSFR